MTGVETSNDFIETYTGAAFYPAVPDVSDVSIIDIAHGLAYECRWSRMCPTFYSVAQHCCLLETYVEKHGGTPVERLHTLMHDGAEGYIGDMARPIKNLIPGYRVLEAGVQDKILRWLCLGPCPDFVHAIDSRIMADERAQLAIDRLEWGLNLEPLGIEIQPWGPHTAEQQFLMRYASLMHAITGEHQYLRSGWGIPTDAKYTRFNFRTSGSDTRQLGDPDGVTTDVLEVDLRGGVARIAKRSPNGMLVRDTAAGKYPRAAWKWVRGSFQLSAPDVHKMPIQLSE